MVRLRFAKQSTFVTASPFPVLPVDPAEAVRALLTDILSELERQCPTVREVRRVSTQETQQI